jgi:hypothetical protein
LALAYFAAQTGRQNMRVSEERGDAALFVDKETALHDNTVVHMAKCNASFLSRSREFVNRVICFTDANGDLVLVFQVSGANEAKGRCAACKRPPSCRGRSERQKELAAAARQRPTASETSAKMN